MLKHKNKLILTTAFSVSRTAEPELKFKARALAPGPDT